jgi:hypothetical protein
MQKVPRMLAVAVGLGAGQRDFPKAAGDLRNLG